jgi:hypothetical protein
MGSRCFVPGRIDLAAEIGHWQIAAATVRLHVTGRAAIVAIGRAQPIVPGVAATGPRQVAGLPTVLRAAAIVAVP